MMLQKLSQHIAACYERAGNCKQRAEEAADSAMKTELLDLESSWTHLARSYEFVESVERFLLSSRNDPNGKVAMTQAVPAEAAAPAESYSYPRCRGCGGTMRLFGIEPHPTVEQTDLRTYVCSTCDETETEIVPLSPN
jgi:hypothetical protein